MKFIKVETGFGGWDEYTDAGVFVQHVTNAEHTRLVNQMIHEHAHAWFATHGMPVDPSQWANGIGHKLYGKIYNAIDNAVNTHPDLPVEQSIRNAVSSINQTFNASLSANPTPVDIYGPILKSGLHEVADPFIRAGFEMGEHVTSLLLMVMGGM